MQRSCHLLQTEHLSKPSSNSSLSSPEKIAKISSNGTSPISQTQSRPASVQTQNRPTSGQGRPSFEQSQSNGNRQVLRTRRQAAQEEEEQRNRARRKSQGPESIEQNEDCGRLI